MSSLSNLKTTDTLDMRLDNLWSNVEDAEIELEFDKQVTDLYFKKLVSISDYTKLKTSMSKLKGKIIIRERTIQKKTNKSTKHKALSDSVAEFLREELSKISKNSSATTNDTKDITSISNSSVNNSTFDTINSEKVKKINNSDGLDNYLLESNLERNLNNARSPDRIEKIKEKKLKRDGKKAADAGGGEVDNSWGGFFCCVSDRGATSDHLKK
jgi:hypothetical protein